MMMKKLTISEMKELNKQAGQKWFDKGAMKFFNTKIEDQPNVANIFITSEYMDYPSDKFYSLRWFNTKDNTVETLGDFGKYETLTDAREARKEFTKSKKEMGIDW